MINIVTEPVDRSWILRRMAEELAKLPGVRIHPPEPGEPTYYLNYALMPEKKPTGFSFAYFTHREEDNKPLMNTFDRAMVDCDFPILMNRGLCNKTRVGQRYKIIHPGSDANHERGVTFGVIGRTYPSGRKGESLVSQMVHDGYRVLVWGRGWPTGCMDATHLSLSNFYQEIDYLVIPSLNEGGPVPLLDAMAERVPVIAPNVGFCWDYPVIRYDRGDWKSLKEVLYKLAHPRSWDNWREDHRQLFEELGFLR